MVFKFNSSKRPTIGVEIELQVIQPWTLDLAPGSEAILKEFENDPQVTAEMQQSMIEVNSGKTSDVKECYNNLRGKILEAVQSAEKIGLKLSVAGTHPFQKWTNRLITNYDRYQHIYKKYQWLARRMNVYGTHVHIGVENGEKALLITSSLIKYLPHLLALSANSPFWQGIDTGMKSSRISVMESFPFAGLPPIFTNWQEYMHYYDTLKTSGAIGSLKDLYWHIRPNHHYGTVEVRICDAMTNICEIMAITALIQCLVVKISREEEDNKDAWTNKHHWIAPENNWIAARDGLDGMIIVDFKGRKKKISDDLYEIIESLQLTAVELGCEDEIAYLKGMIERGNGADRQRLIYNETQSHGAVVAQIMDEFHKSISVPAMPQKNICPLLIMD